MADDAKPTARKRGRKAGECHATAYKPEMVEQARKLCNLGATDAEVADFFEVDRVTLYRWRHRYTELAEAMGAGKNLADERVVRALYQAAVGYDFTEQQAIKVKVGPSLEEVRVVEVERHVPAQAAACIMWLKNRRRDEWRDRHDHEHSGPGGKPIETITTTMTAKEAAERYRDELG